MNVSIKYLTAALACISLLFEISESISLVPQFSASGNRTVYRVRRQDQGQVCGFQCKTTPQCIDVDKECDGIEDCQDGSDEYESLCKTINCPGYLFKCEYGACISKDQRCNGAKDCKDNSDEVGCPKQVKINTNCRSDQFECDNGQCIEVDGKCNGVADCEDKSDETQELCFNIYCPGYTHKCAYGACVDGDAKCNGVQDCLDNSDEDEKSCAVLPITQTPPIVTKTTEAPVGPGPTPGPIGPTCESPAQPGNGQWTYLHNSLQGRAGEKVSANTVIIFTCKNGYKLSSTFEKTQPVLCQGNSWSLTQMPHCQKLCPAYYNSPTTTLTCKDQETGSLVPCDQATDHTQLTFVCAPYYEPPSARTVRYCVDGTWNYERPECVQVCGEKRVSATPLIVNGKEVERGNYPWVAAIYSNQKDPSKFTNICGGSVLTQNLVLTAAHCVTNEIGKPIDVKFFKVGVGKYYNQYEDPRDQDTAQYAEVEQFIINNDYKGDIQNYRADIAIVKLKKQFALSKVVQPVCFHDLRNYPIGRDSIGLITGWGYTESSGKPSDVLKEVELPYKDTSQCEQELPPEWALRYLIHDKMCAGYLNKNTSVCKGDSGGGLVFKHPVTKRYYVHGIVSIAHSFQAGSVVHCDIQKSALFTKVEEYSDWLEYTVSSLSREVH